MEKNEFPLDLKIGFPDGRIAELLECNDRFVVMERQVEVGSEEEKILKNNLRAVEDLQ